VLVLVLALAGCRDHVLDDGPYALAVGAALRDDCGAAGSFRVGPATLRTDGHQVSLTLAEPELRLMGSYRSNVEAFYADGSLSKTAATLAGRECVVDTVSFRVEAEMVSDTSFAGTMAVAWDTAQPEACVCRYWFEFTAARQ
jgi:hypothetical protein